MLAEIVTAIPGPKSLALAQELHRYESRNVTYASPDFPIFWERAQGVNVWDVDGNRFLDLTSGFGVSSLGFTVESVVAAGQQQLAKLHHAMGDVHPAQVKVELCRELSRWTFETWGVGEGKSILTNSGAEAVEAALKTAYLATGKRGILSFAGAYHGLGYGALTVSGLEEFRTPFRAQLADFSQQIPFPDIQSLEPAVTQTTEREIRQALQNQDVGAILVEPIQGRAGVIIPPDWFLPLLRQICSETGALLILDEIYTGFYRTGYRFACDAVGVVPDLICLGKSLTNGFPLAACVGRAEVMDRWPDSDGEALHTSTFLGNPLGCRMALAALRELDQAAKKWSILEKGAQWQEELRRLKLGPVRGRGLLVAVELNRPELPGKLVLQGLKQGLILLTGGPQRNVLTLTPPFPIEATELSWATTKIKQIA
jgi:4-aminobutyrate aminotransferase-like enzyme